MCAYIKLISVFTFAIMLTSVGLSQSNYMASSPDKNIRLVVSRNDAGEIKYSLSYKNKDVIKAFFRWLYFK